jgi:hypothetical protein
VLCFKGEGKKWPAKMVGGNIRIKENDWYYTGKKRNEMGKSIRI